MSEGNGHPISWSAIINGYDKGLMSQCGFPAIPQYLDSQDWPEASIQDALVTHVWTQNEDVSRQIAETCFIDFIVDDFRDMVTEVDAILLARDDARNHAKFAEPFLTAGLPVYVDKPVALSLGSLEDLYRLETNDGKIFSCSALRFSKDLEFSEDDLGELGSIVSLRAEAPKKWEKYAIHAIEPTLKLISHFDTIEHWSFKTSPTGSSSGSRLEVMWSSGLRTEISTSGKTGTPISLEVIGENSSRRRVFGDPFQSFRAALAAFVRGAQSHTVENLDDKDLNRRIVRLIEMGVSS